MSNTALKKEPHPPGDFAIWIIIYVELITFGLLFIGYAFSRRANVEMFNHSQQMLETTSGFINTLLLVTSSYFVVKAVRSIQNMTEGSREAFNKKASKWLLLAMLFGAGFLVNKIFEFSYIFGEGINLSTNKFFMFYLLLTGFHFMHVLLGSVILFNIFQKTRVYGYTIEDHKGIISGAAYWHMVDFLWIILFPLVYIIR